jgi:hypothetical protein
MRKLYLHLHLPLRLRLTAIIRHLQHQGKYLEKNIKYRKLEKFSISRKINSQGKKYRVPYTVNISKETFWNKNSKIFKKTTGRLVKNQQTAKKMAEAWSMSKLD